MADTVNYVIRIEGGDGSGGGGGIKKKAVADSPDGQSKQNALAKKLGKFASPAFAIQAVKQVGAQHIGRIELNTGHATLQQRTAYAYSHLSSAIDAVTSIIGGAVVGGGYGAAAAAVGVGISMIAGVGSIVSKQIDISKQMTIEHYSIQQANIRAGAGGDRLGRNKT